MTAHELHARHSGWKFFDSAQIRKAFGPSVTKLIPSFPEYTKLRKDSADSETIVARFGCGCYGNLTDPEEVKRLRKQEDTEKYTYLDVNAKGKMRGQDLLDTLLQAVRNGSRVDPIELATAREQVVIDRINAEVEEERRQAEAFEAEKQAGINAYEFSESLAIELAASSAELQQAALTAAHALAHVFELAQEHRQTVQSITEQLNSRGIDPQPDVDHFTESIIIGTSKHEFWRGEHWAAAILAAVAEHYPRLAGPRWSRAELPRPTRGGPTVKLPKLEGSST